MLHRENRKPLLSCGSLLMKEADVKNGRNFTEDLRLWDAQWLQYTKGEICQKYLLTQQARSFGQTSQRSVLPIRAAPGSLPPITSAEIQVCSVQNFPSGCCKVHVFSLQRRLCIYSRSDSLSLIKQNLSVCVKEVYTFISYKFELLPFINP